MTLRSSLAPLGVAAALAVAAPDAPRAAGTAAAPARKAAAAVPDSPQGIQAEAPPFTPGIFPCSQCHDRAGDAKRRELAFHDEVQAGLKHGAPTRWCLDCHDNARRDFLHLTGGELVPFTESYRLCGQCHGDKYRDWRAGVHGKRTGAWNGQKTYYLCVNCHDPHNPRFKALKPEPPPVLPSQQGLPRPEKRS
jgi:hypothetical protein